MGFLWWICLGFLFLFECLFACLFVRCVLVFLGVLCVCVCVCFVCVFVFWRVGGLCVYLFTYYLI